MTKNKEEMMTDTTNTTDVQGGQQKPTPGTQDPQQTGTPAPASEQSKGGNAEAAKYRTQLRATEAERDTLTARLETAHRTMVEGIASKSLAKPEALWASGTKLADLLDDDGNVDPEKVTAAISDAKERLGLERPAHGPIVPGQGDTPERRLSPETFANAFGPR